MPTQSRRKRKRERRRQLAEATANSPKRSGGWGQGLELFPRDLLLLRRAVREGWATPIDVAHAAVNDVVQLGLSHPKPRYRIAAVRVLVSMAAANQRAELADARALANRRLRGNGRTCTPVESQ